MKKQGWVKLYRQSINSTVWKKPTIWSVWSWCLMKANHKENKFPFNGKDIIIKKGEFITGINKAVRELPNISIQQYRTAIKYLKSTDRITSQATNQFTLISVVNWEEYQNDNKQTNKPITNEQQADNKQITTNKNDKNVKKRKENILQATPAEYKIPEINTPKIIPENKQIAKIISIFREKNKALKFQDKTQRKAISDFIQEYNFQEAVKWAKFAISIQGKDKFAPRITTPYQFWHKLTALKIYEKTNQKSYDNTTNTEFDKYAKLSRTSY